MNLLHSILRRHGITDAHAFMDAYDLKRRKKLRNSETGGLWSVDFAIAQLRWL